MNAINQKSRRKEIKKKGKQESKKAKKQDTKKPSKQKKTSKQICHLILVI